MKQLRHSLSCNYPFIRDWKTKVLIAMVIFLVSSFVILFLEPFKTSESRKVIVLGYGVCLLLCYDILLLVEFMYFKQYKKWQLKNEVSVLAALFVMSAFSVYIYDIKVIKNIEFYWSLFIPFVGRVVIPFGVILVPFIVWLRRHYGKIYEQPNDNVIKINGVGNSDFLEVDYRNVYYVKSSNNYVEVFFEEEGMFKTKITQVYFVECSYTTTSFSQMSQELFDKC